MMERERSSKNQRGKENDLRLKVFCLTPTPAKVEHDTSVYEINIESDFEFCTPGKKCGKMAPVKESVAAFETKDIEARNKRNPFLDSYYPSIVEIHPDINEQTETDVEFSREEKKTFVERADKESQSSPNSTRELPYGKNMKNIILENFIPKSTKDWKTILENGSNELEKSELHLHHHEHHHYHYYCHHDDKSILSERIPSSNPTRVFSARTTRTEHTSPERRCYVANKQNSTFSNTTFTKSMPRAKPEEPPVTKIPKHGTGAKSSSVESVFNKKSDFIKSHTYSDRDMTKYESEDTVTFETNSRPSKKSTKSTFSTVLNSLKNLNDLKSPVIITDQESIPRLSYITCECGSSETLSQSSNTSNTNSVNTGEIVEETSLEGEDLSGLTGNSKKNKKEFSSQVWNAKLIEGLKRIRNELIRLQEKHSRKNKSDFVKSGDWKSVPPLDSSSPRVVVSSCKTFVFLAPVQNTKAEGSFKRLNFREVELNSRSVCLLKRKKGNVLRETERPHFEQICSTGFRRKLFV